MDHAMTWLFLRMVLLITVVFLLANGAKAKRKDDVVTMKNGNSFTGEIKELEHGELVFKSEYMKDSVHLDWKQVRSLRSKDVFIVSLNDGRRLTGNIDRFKTLNFSSGAFLFSSVSEPGRFWFSSQSNLRIELVRNFNWILQLHENHDTRPPVTAPKNDLRIATVAGLDILTGLAGFSLSAPVTTASTCAQSRALNMCSCQS
jgi:hypothetical protein